ncbi:MAG: GNAT family N-acetyltransferase, partial [bacterium]|nr:GNAT family N-acetyltransferase [bacterium]
GDDYLELVSEKWLNQTGFYVGEVNGKVIACGKITILPEKIAWLEGLRVHGNFRGNGYGRLLSDQILQIAKRRLNNGEFRNIEFSTYVSNIESISMAEKQGFAVSEQFHVLNMENPQKPSFSTVLNRFSPSSADFRIYPQHAPCGWKYILHSGDGSLSWFEKNAEFWQVETGASFLAANRGYEISPLASAFEDQEGFIRGILAFAELKRLDYLVIMAHDSHKDILNTAVKNGFSYWDEQGVANLPVYRLGKKAEGKR